MYCFHWCGGDITNSVDVKHINDSTVNNYGSIDILVSGIFISTSPIYQGLSVLMTCLSPRMISGYLYSHLCHVITGKLCRYHTVYLTPT